jgi:tight adherence protein B
VLAGGVVAAVGVFLGAPAYAATGKIDQVTPGSGDHVSVVFGAVGLPAGDTIDTTSVQVRIDGQPVPATATAYGKADTATLKRSAILTIDTSGSMRDAGLAGAKSAATAFLSSVPPDVAVGLVAFADTARVVVAPTTDRTKVRDAVTSLAAVGRTALYDGVALAAKTLGTTGSRSIVLLSDGNDTASTATLAQATATVTASKVALDAVSLGKAEQAQSAALTALTKAGRGQLVSVDQPQELTKVFESAAQAIASQVLVDVTVPPGVMGTSKPLAISATAGTQTVGDSVVALFPAAGAAPTADYGPQPVASTQPSLTSESWFLPVAIGAVGIGLLVLLGVAFLSRDDENATTGRVSRRLSRYSLTSRKAASVVDTSGALGSSQIARSAVDLAGKVTQKGDLDTTLGTRLDAAGVPLRPAEWVLLHVGAPVVLGLALLLLTGFSLVAGLLGVVIGVVVPFAYLSIKESRRKAAFAAQLADTLQLLAGSLSAGYSLPQATDVVVRESSAPMSDELNRALVEARLGVPLEDALDTIATRMDNVDMSWVVMAIRIQREVGGNLAEVLNQVAATLRERERLRRQVQVLSAEGRLSAGILIGLPLVFIVYLVLVRPEYLSKLVTEPLGILMSVIGVVLLIGGTFWMRKVIKVEV